MSAFTGGEPQRIVPGNNIELLDKGQSILYKKWYDSKPKDKREHIPNATLTRQMIREPFCDYDDSVSNFAIRDENNNFIAGGSVLGCTLRNGKRFGELTGVYVELEKRKQGLASQIDKKRQEWCENQENKFEWLQTHIASTNIPSLRLKLKQGFTIIDIAEDAKEHVGSCLLKNAKVDVETKFETVNISLSDLAKLEQLTTNGWEGTDLQPITDQENLDPTNWLLTLRRKK